MLEPAITFTATDRDTLAKTTVQFSLDSQDFPVSDWFQLQADGDMVRNLQLAPDLDLTSLPVEGTLSFLIKVRATEQNVTNLTTKSLQVAETSDESKFSRSLVTIVYTPVVTTTTVRPSSSTIFTTTTTTATAITSTTTTGSTTSCPTQTPCDCTTLSSPTAITTVTTSATTSTPCDCPRCSCPLLSSTSTFISTSTLTSATCMQSDP